MTDTDSFVELYITENNLIIDFGGRNIVMELKDEEEKDIMNRVLSDPNLWTNFLGSLSAALGQHR